MTIFFVCLGVGVIGFLGWRLWRALDDSWDVYREEVQDFEFEKRLARERKEGLR